MSKVRSITQKAVLCLLILASAFALFAQSDNGTITGIVKDSTGSVIPNARIQVRNETTGLERSVVSNESGVFISPSLPAGNYTVTVESAGFKKYTTIGNKLDATSVFQVQVTLEVGQVSESVEVTASTANVQTETATVGKVIESSQIKTIPLQGRNPLFLALMKPGVRGGALGGFSFNLTSGGFAINGSRSDDNLIYFDGAVGTRTRSNGTSIGTADLETVQEMQILTANYNAEYGRSGGGQIRFVTRSGGKDLHAEAYEYFRNSAMDANQWDRNRVIGQPTINSRPAPFRYNQFGFIVSGPVVLPKFNRDRNKLFFLVSQEYVRFRSESLSQITVPSLPMRRGDFSELLNASNPFFNRVRVVNDPLNNNTPFPNNVIPQDRLSPNGIGLLRAYPEPTPGFQLGTNNFVQSRPQPQNQLKTFYSMDVIPTDKHTIRLRAQDYRLNTSDAFRGGTDRAPAFFDRPNLNGSINWTWVVSPTVINETLATASVDRVYIRVLGDRYRRSLYGINYPYLYPTGKEIFDKVPTIDIANFAQIDGGPYPSQSAGPIYQISNNTTKIRGNHTFKVGAMYERNGQNDFDQINVNGVPGGTNNQNGRFQFFDTGAGITSSGVAVANAALGYFQNYAELGNRSYTPYRGQMLEWFAQDSWRVNSKLKLELGMRHTVIVPYYSLWGNMVVFDPKYYDPTKAAVLNPANGAILSGDQYSGLVIPGDKWPSAANGRVPAASDRSFDRLFKGLPRQYGNISLLNFVPRLGLAYSIDSKTVFRTGFGGFKNRPAVSDSVFLGGNPPLQPSQAIANGRVDQPSGGSSQTFPFFVQTIDPVQKIPTAYNWNATVERQLPFQTIVEIGYVGRVGLWLERTRNINQLQLGTVQANPGRDVNSLRPYQGYGPITLGEFASRSQYHGLQVGVNRRYSKGFSYGFAYTYSRSLDNASGRRDTITNSFNDTNWWGPSSFDTRHVAVINWIYEMPFFKNNKASGKLLGGWQIMGVSQFQTGTPFTVNTGDDFAGVGPGSGGQFWNVNGSGIQLDRGSRNFSNGVNVDQNFWFRTTLPDGTPMFTAPRAGTIGNQTRNTIYNPGFQNWNMGLIKKFAITERQAVTFRAESFNWINLPNWSGADTNPRSGTFGRVTAKNSQRQFQLSLRYQF